MNSETKSHYLNQVRETEEGQDTIDEEEEGFEILVLINPYF